MYPYTYQNYKENKDFNKEDIPRHSCINGCDMNETNGWGEIVRDSTTKDESNNET
ncbi:hypothetical protein N9N03_00055 [Chlamydiia bacterium]|nr:hypothetical protein [Chlamydiia bacterium]